MHISEIWKGMHQHGVFRNPSVEGLIQGRIIINFVALGASDACDK